MWNRFWKLFEEHPRPFAALAFLFIAVPAAINAWLVLIDRLQNRQPTDVQATTPSEFPWLWIATALVGFVLMAIVFFRTAKIPQNQKSVDKWLDDLAAADRGNLSLVVRAHLQPPSFSDIYPHQRYIRLRVEVVSGSVFPVHIAGTVGRVLLKGMEIEKVPELFSGRIGFKRGQPTIVDLRLWVDRDASNVILVDLLEGRPVKLNTSHVELKLGSDHRRFGTDQEFGIRIGGEITVPARPESGDMPEALVLSTTESNNVYECRLNGMIKRHIEDESALRELGYQRQDILYVNEAVLDEFEEGPIIPSPAHAQNSAGTPPPPHRDPPGHEAPVEDTQSEPSIAEELPPTEVISENVR